jgi:surfactin synthase thioesterase subunit
MYYRWPSRIGHIEVCLIQPPARENRIREPHYETYEALARTLVEFLPPYLDRPFGFFGHCGGALPGVELTHQLHELGLPVPQRVFVSSQVAPHNGPYGRYLTLGTDDLADELRRLIISLGGNPTPAFVRMGLELLCKDLDANRRYRPDGLRRLPCGITAIGWREDREIPMPMMEGWRDLSPACRFVMLEGAHYEFLGAPPALLAEIARDLSPDANTLSREDARSLEGA